MYNETTRRAHRLAWLFAGLLLAVHFAWAVGSKLGESTAYDEIIHLTSGVSYWTQGDYRLQPENGVLPQRWMAIPAVLSGAKFPSTKDNRSWHNADAWLLGHRFFYDIPGQDHFPILMAARAMIALFSVGIGALVFGWSLRLFGVAGAFVSLIFFVACPNFLAHGALATSDVCLCFFMLACAGAWWRCLQDGDPGLILLSAALFGLACVAKYSAVLLIPMMLVMAVVRAASPSPMKVFGRSASSAFGKLLAAGGVASVHAMAAFATIWLLFGFRYSAFNPAASSSDHFYLSFDGLVAATGWKGTIVGRLASWHALPEAFLYGFAYVVETTRARPGFLNGQYSTAGWPSYFPWTFALKTTLPFLAAIALSLAAGLRGRLSSKISEAGGGLYRLTPLWVLAVVYGAFAVGSHINIGIRHLLPIYPTLFILAGCLGQWLTARDLRAFVVAGLLAWHVAESVRATPDFIAYFNELGGGPGSGYHHFADSSVDWGQDLPGLARWLGENARPAEPVYLAYFGTGEPDYYAIRARRIVFANGIRQLVPPFVPLGPGLYCISATIVDNMSTPVSGPWTLEHEKEFQSLRAEAGPAHDRKRFAELRLSRLNAYLEVRRPDAQIGHSILVFRLTADEVARTAEGTTREWADLIARACPKDDAAPGEPPTK